MGYLTNFKYDVGLEYSFWSFCPARYRSKLLRRLSRLQFYPYFPYSQKAGLTVISTEIGVTHFVPLLPSYWCNSSYHTLFSKIECSPLFIIHPSFSSCPRARNGRLSFEGGVGVLSGLLASCLLVICTLLYL